MHTLKITAPACSVSTRQNATALPLYPHVPSIRAPTLSPVTITTRSSAHFPELNAVASRRGVVGTSFSAEKAPKPDSVATKKPRVVVLGSGWGAASFMKGLPADISERYEVVLVSPRNYFLYTPLLPAVATGTMEERSIVEPVRHLMQGKGTYYEASCVEVDPDHKRLGCCYPGDEGCFYLSYDILIMAVGSVNSTFGIKGVEQHCNFFKTIADAHKLRGRVSECFERAALPTTSQEDRKRLLSFVIVGGGPTGVEVAAEIHDMVHQDLAKLYPKLIQDVQIRVIDMMDRVLATYDKKISAFTAEQFKKADIQLMLNSRLASVGDGLVEVVAKDNSVTAVPFGACVWATGVAMNPLVKALQRNIPGQNHPRCALTDVSLCVLGSNGSIFAVGDAATIDMPRAQDHADLLFELADEKHHDKITFDELSKVLAKASQGFPHLREHAEFLASRKSGLDRWAYLLSGIVTPHTNGPAALGEITGATQLTKEQFKAILVKIDSGVRALPPTAQVAKQQGEFLAEMFVEHALTGDRDDSPQTLPQFHYFHKGSAAYVGDDKAVFDVPRLGPLTGTAAGAVWKGFETYSQISFRNQCLVASDWLRTKLFGRDISQM